MSLSAAQIFVRSEDAAGVEEVVAQALYEWALGVGDLPIREDGSTTPLDRHVVLLPPVEGWITLIESEGRVDRALARNLHARTGALVLALELDGHFLSASIEVEEEDGTSDDWSSPAPREEPEAMPVYVDVEDEVWNRVTARGVPPALIATDWEDMVDATSPVADGCRLTASAGVEGLVKDVVPFGDIASFEVLDGPRVRPDLWVSNPDGDAEVVEARRVTGEWNHEAVRALATIEERQLQRILGTLAWTTEDTFLPRVRFTYEGVDDEDGFNWALAVARRDRPRLAAWEATRWRSVNGLVEALVDVAAEYHPKFEVGRRCGTRLELRHRELPAACLYLDLDTLWREYQQTPDDLRGVAESMLPPLLDAGKAVAPFDADRLFPMLLGRGTPGLASFSVRPFVEDTFIAVGVDTDDALVPLTREALRLSGVGFDDALDVAITRLDLATERDDGFTIFEQPEGITLVAEFADTQSAARILSPAVRGHIAQQLGDGCYVAIPSRDVLVAAERTPEARKWVEREVTRRFETGDLPLSRRLWTIENGELEEAQEAESGADWAPPPEDE